jgi:hypothetical protein
VLTNDFEEMKSEGEQQWESGTEKFISADGMEDVYRVDN